MKCPFCGQVDKDKVIDSRPSDDNSTIRRRRECTACGQRFTTHETIEVFPVLVIKRDGRRENFDRNKIIDGLTKACMKRPVSVSDMEKIVDTIENSIQNSNLREIPAEKIGDMVLQSLYSIDKVAYVRFASVYRHFDDLETFFNELTELLNTQDAKK